MALTAASMTVDRRNAGSRLLTFLALALAGFVTLTVGIVLAGRMLGPTIVMGGYSDSPKTHRVLVAGHAITVAESLIRFGSARHDGAEDRLDLYMRWPQLDGYSAEARDDFNAVDGRRRILFVSFTVQTMSRDMGGRYEPIYKGLVDPTGKAGPAGVTFHDFLPGSGYVDETLAVVERPGAAPFVARCLTGSAAETSLAPCERDVLVGDNLSVTYRFPAELLADWAALERDMLRKVKTMLDPATR